MKIVLSIMVLVLLSGCGGGSGSSAVPQASPTTRAIITNTLRTFKNGDFIRYNLTGTSTVGAVSSVLAGTGKVTYTLQSPADPLGNTHASETYVSNITSNGVPLAVSTTVNYFDQLANGTFRFWGDNFSQWITSPIAGNVTRFFSPIVTGNTWQHTYIPQSSEQIIETVTVNANVVITIPLGSFETIKITTTQDRQSKANANAPYASFQKSTKIDYIVPSIGIIKSTNITNSIGMIPATTTNATIEATTTNIAF